ncbi:MAG: Helix-turn-helix domain [Pseudomonadota bacterium]
MAMHRERALPILLEVGKTIRTYRKAQSLTQRQVAERAGMTPEAICRIETGAVLPDLSTLPRIAEVLDVAPAALLREPNLPHPAAVLRGWTALSEADRAIVRDVVARLLATAGGARST